MASSLLKETRSKVEAGLRPALADCHDGLDFWQVKHELLLSYLIDLVAACRNQQTDARTQHRLVVAVTALDKLRSLEKKLQYQIDKLLAMGNGAGQFAEQHQATEDPLQYRPGGDDESSDGDDDGSDDENDEDENESTEADDMDNDLATARLTLSMAAATSKKPEEETVYRAPRIAAVPYTHDKVDRQAERLQRQKRRLKASEVAQTLRDQYGDAPEHEDVHGGTAQRDTAARKMQEREAEKTQYEESAFVRLTTTRQEKKERKRLQRQEGNLAAMANLGNLVRESRVERVAPVAEEEERDRYDNGKRKKQRIDRDGRPLDSKRRGHTKAKNSLQANLFGEGPKKSKKR